MEVPVVIQVEVPQIQTGETSIEVPFVHTVEMVVEDPQLGQTTDGTQWIRNRSQSPPQRTQYHQQQYTASSRSVTSLLFQTVMPYFTEPPARPPAS